jgi:hypothetical protein
MKTYIIKANEELFDEWKKLGLKIENMNCIIQNDMVATLDQLGGWELVYQKTKLALERLHELTLNSIMDNEVE